ncbi:MAG: AMP-binding protein [Thermoanaerobaculia bacterium]
MSWVEDVAAAAQQMPEDPWLFEPEGHDWRWLSFAEVWRRCARLAHTLGSLPPGTRVGYPDLAYSWAIVADVAIQAAGLVAVPVAPGAAVKGLGGWVRGPVEVPEPAGVPCFVMAPVSADESPTGTSPGAGPLASELPRPGGGFELEAPPRKKPPPLPPLGDSGFARLGAPAGGRDVTVLSAPLESILGRQLLLWSAASRAALLLPGRSAWLPAAVWARATVLAGTSAELAQLRSVPEVDQPVERWRRSRMVRLRGWVGFGEAPAAELEAYWKARGVRIEPLGSAASVALPR